MPNDLPVSGFTKAMPDIGSFREILKYLHYNSFILFDLDNTLMESSQALGSDQWFSYFLSAVCQLLPNEPQALLWVLAVYDAVQHFTEVQATEVSIKRLIKMLQAIGLPIVAVTARGESIVEPTLKQLNSIDISFAQQWPQIKVPLNHAERRIVFSDGIVFCNGQDKGLSVKLLFEWLGQIPQEILMVDDKAKHLTSVAKKLAAKTHFQGLRYSYLDAKVNNFDARQSDEQLLAVLKQFPLNVQTIFKKIPWSKNPHSLFKAFVEREVESEIKLTLNDEALRSKK